MNKTDNSKEISKTSEFKQALDKYMSELQKNPDNAQLHVQIGDLYLKEHKDIYQPVNFIDEAITQYQRALELDIDSGSIHYKMGLAFYLKGDLDKALSHVNLAIEYKKTLAEAYLLKCNIFVKKDRFREAVEFAELSVDYGGLSSSQAYYKLYILHSVVSNKSFGNNLKSFYYFLMSVLLLPFDKAAQEELAYKLGYFKFFGIILKGYFYTQKKEYQSAIDLYMQAIEEAPGFVPLYLLLADVYAETYRYEEAINEYRMALWYDPLNLQAYKSLAAIYEERGDYDNSLLMYKKLIELNPNNPSYYSNLAGIKYMKGDVKEAILNYHHAIMLNPNNDWTSVVSQTLGYIFSEVEKNYDAAISAYQNAFILTPKNIDIYINLGSAFYDKGDFESALAVYKLALDLEPENAKIHCNLGYLYGGKGMIDEAISEYELAIKYDPTYDIAYNNLGVIYLDDKGMVMNALTMFDEAIKCNPNYALAHYNKARAIVIRGDYIEAARYYQIALDLNKITNEMDPEEIKNRLDNLFD